MGVDKFHTVILDTNRTRLGQPQCMCLHLIGVDRLGSRRLNLFGIMTGGDHDADGLAIQLLAP